MTQDEYDDLMTDERMERKGRFASGPEDDPDFEIRFCEDCGREKGDFCSHCREHDRRRDDPLRLAEIETIQALNKLNFPKGG